MSKEWNSGAIEDLCEVEYGTRVVRKNDAGTIYPVYGGGGATFSMDISNREDRMVIARFAMSEKCTRFVNGKFYLNDSGLTISPKNDNVFDISYLNYHILSLNDEIYSLARGTAQKNLNVDAFKKVQLSYPLSLEKQKQIVDKLDQAFAAIDTAKLNVEKNLENAKELFQSKLNEIFSQKGEGWDENKLCDVCEINPPKKESKLKLEDEDLVSFVPMKNLGVLKQDLILKENRALDSVYSSYTYFADNDVLLAKITPCFENGKIGIAKNLKNGVGFGSSEFVVYRPNESIESEFLFYFLCRDKFRKYGVKVMTGAVGHKRIPKEFISDQLILTPSIETQKNTINTLNKLKRKIQALESTYQQELNSLVELKKSILEKAFAGEL